MTDHSETAAVAALGQAPEPIPRDLVRLIAEDIGKAVAHHLETMYPAAVAATSSTMLLSVRNATHNEIIAALSLTNEAAILEWLKVRKAHRRRINALRRAGADLERERQANPPRNADEALVRVHDAMVRHGTTLSGGGPIDVE